MNDIEIPFRHFPHSGNYNMLDQQDYTGNIVPTYHEDSRDSEMRYQDVRPSKSQSTLSAAFDQQEPHERKLPPKAFQPLPLNVLVRRHIVYAVGAIMSIGIFITVHLVAHFGPGSSNSIYKQGDTFCTAIALTALTGGGSTWLDVTTGYGKFTFSEAKFIDLAWDIVVSRGGQVLLGYITYRVYTAMLLLIMEESRVSYDLYAALTLQYASITSLRPLIKAFFTKLGWRKNLLLVWLGVSVIWVALWPVITNAMTGYVSTSDTWVRPYNSSIYVNYTDIANYGNLGFQFFNVSKALNSGGSYEFANPLGPIILNSGPNNTLYNELLNLAVARKNLEGLLLTFPNVTSTATYTIAPDIFYFYQNHSYEATYFINPKNVQCLANGTYQWGFASAIAFFFAIFNCLWTIGTYGVWIHMLRKSEMLRMGRDMGKYRAVLDLAEAIGEGLGKDVCAYGNSEISHVLRSREGVRYAVQDGREGDLGHVGLSERDRIEKVKLRFGEAYGGRIET